MKRTCQFCRRRGQFTAVRKDGCVAWLGGCCLETARHDPAMWPGLPPAPAEAQERLDVLLPAGEEEAA